MGDHICISLLTDGGATGRQGGRIVEKRERERGGERIEGEEGKSRGREKLKRKLTC